MKARFYMIALAMCLVMALPALAGNKASLDKAGQWQPPLMKISDGHQAPPDGLRDVICPGGGIPEGEVDCYDDYDDTYNSGCNSSGTPAFTCIEPSASQIVICGTTGVFDFGGSGYRDTDWYEINLNNPATITVQALCETDVVLGFIDGRNGCPVSSFYSYTTSAAEVLTPALAEYLDSGTWWIFVSTADWNTAWACGSDYNLYVSGYDDGPPCVAPPSDVTCVQNGTTQVDLSWTNNDTYDSINIYANGSLVSVAAGTATTYTDTPPDKGYYCYTVCGVVGTYEFCSEECCLIFGYDGTTLLWDFEADDGGFVNQGTGGWEWGAPTFGPCYDTADGNVWATYLNGEYTNGGCWILDSAPIVFEGDKGGFLCFDHCYDIEPSYDGANVWFTTDDYWYYLWEPVAGYPGTNNGLVPHCSYVNNRPTFDGYSGGWVTDCWDMTDPAFFNYPIVARFVLASDSTQKASGWMIDNVTLYQNAGGTIDCLFTCTPSTGTLPFGSFFDITLFNLEPLRPATRVSARIDLSLANGSSYSNWKSGTVNIAKGGSFNKAWTQSFPAAGALVGTNYFTLRSWDVTPTPYNQPPYEPSGDSCTSQCVLVANAP